MGYTAQETSSILLGIVATTLIGIPRAYTFQLDMNIAVKFRISQKYPLWKWTLPGLFGRNFIETLFTVAMLVILLPSQYIWFRGTLLWGRRPKPVRLIDENGEEISAWNRPWCQTNLHSSRRNGLEPPASCFWPWLNSAQESSRGKDGAPKHLLLQSSSWQPIFSFRWWHHSGVATAPAWFFVGILMPGIRGRGFSDMSNALPAPALSYSCHYLLIANGLHSAWLHTAWWSFTTGGKQDVKGWPWWFRFLFIT